MKKLLVIFYIISILCFISCEEEIGQKPPVYIYQEPIQIDDGWEISSLSAQNMDVSLITEMIINVKENVFKNIHGILIIRNEKLVLEEYFPGESFYFGEHIEYNWNVLHHLASCTKSFTSALIGIAFDQGYIIDLNAPLYSFFPEYPEVDWSGDKQKITLEHLLTMTAGLDWDEWAYSYFDERNIHYQMYVRADPVKFLLEVPIEEEPGTTFNYNSGLSVLLGAIIKNSTALYANQFAELYLFGPLGIEEYEWEVLGNGTVQTGGGLSLLPRDMGKFGQLYLNGGKWKGEPVISQYWVEESVRKHITSNWNRYGYGFQWWSDKHYWNGEIIDSFFASGLGGQHIFVFPELEMVVVVTGGNHHTGADPALTMLHQYILPAVYF
ncbi:MAG: serine hydrolase [Candidatus Aminicenantes bacterium]|nr:MAG: serine hydrolase [Candidatus Aminicenantes bacterium]